jgi:hypothetical protein
MEEKLKVTWAGAQVEIVMRDITWEEKINCTKKAMVDIVKGRKVTREFDPILHKQLLMVLAMKEVPFDKTLDNLGKLSARDGERVYAVYAKLNEVGEETDEEG